MTLSEATKKASELRTALLDTGIKAVTIELVEGRGGAGWYDGNKVATMGHHIVSYRTQGLTPGLALVKRGRTDLPGPLCNGYGGFDEVARIICMAWANHSGAGGPYTVPSGTIPINNGRPYIFGWEHEGGVKESDWTDSFRIFMGRCHAGTLNWLGLDERSHLEHKTWAPTRKSDRLNYTLTEAKAELQPYLKGNQAQEDLMFTRGYNEAEWKVLWDKGFVKGTSWDVFKKYWVTDAIKRTDAEHLQASGNVVLAMARSLAGVTTDELNKAIAAHAAKAAGPLNHKHGHDEGVSGGPISI